MRTTALRLAKAVIPASLRSRLRRSAMLRSCVRRWLSGVRSMPLPPGDLTFYFDGYRHASYELHGAVELEERDSVDRLLETHRWRSFWDVGANIGYWSLYLTARLGRELSVRAFEPDEENLVLLRMNADRNHLPWVVRPVGVSDRVGAALFNRDTESGATGSLESGHQWITRNFGMQTTGCEIPLTTIDHEVADGAIAPEMMKIDVEGHEAAVFRGGLETLRVYRPCIMFETSEMTDLEYIRKVLNDLGYRLYDARLNRVEHVGLNSFALPT